MSVLTPRRSAPSRKAARTPSARENFSGWANRHRKWLFAAPAMIFVGVLIVFPLAWTLYLSLTDSQGSVRAASEFRRPPELPHGPVRRRALLARRRPHAELHRRRARLRGGARHVHRAAAVAPVPRRKVGPRGHPAAARRHPRGGRHDVAADLRPQHRLRQPAARHGRHSRRSPGSPARTRRSAPPSSSTSGSGPRWWC